MGNAPRTNRKWIILLVVAQASLAAALVLIPPAHRTEVASEAADVPETERVNRPIDVVLHDAGRELEYAVSYEVGCVGDCAHEIPSQGSGAWVPAISAAAPFPTARLPD